jgi:hypothetical protein
MKSKKIFALWVAGALLAAQLACNLPDSGTVGGATQLPPVNQTLTAIFQEPPAEATATPTLPPVVTATSSGPGAADPTATTAPVTSNPTATTAPVTSNPTATNALPQASATIPSMRPRAAVVAKYMSTPPIIDGDWSEWKDQGTEYPANQIVHGRENWTGAEDLSASFYVGWDDNYLYLAVKVRDDQYVQNASGADLFKGDSIEIMLDTNLQDDFYYTSLSADDFQLGISPGRPDVNGTREAYLWYPSSIAGPRSSVTIASRMYDDGVYRVEAAIPWSVFETKPSNGTNMGFVLSVSDNDNPSANVQQTMVSNVADRKLTDPTTWGNIQFTR